MTLIERLTELKKSEIFRLIYNNNFIALRIRYFNLDSCKFEYYDFYLDTISRNDLKSFVESLTCKEMHLRSVNGELISDIELENGAHITELNDSASVDNIMVKMKEIYNYKGVA